MLKKTDLVKYFSDGIKLKGSEKIGTEHEKFIYNKSDLSLIPFFLFYNNFESDN